MRGTMIRGRVQGNARSGQSVKRPLELVLSYRDYLIPSVLEEDTFQHISGMVRRTLFGNSLGFSNVTSLLHYAERQAFKEPSRSNQRKMNCRSAKGPISCLIPRSFQAACMRDARA